ncbi:MAG: hypothetical protein AAGH65_00400 [Pseudomonadota bacterium]
MPVVDELDLRVMLAGLPRLQTELDEEAEVVQTAMGRFTPRLVATMPDDVLGDPLEMVGVAGTLAMIAAVIDDRPTREAFVERTFVLGFLYAEELSNTRASLNQARDRLNAALAHR